MVFDGVSSMEFSLKQHPSFCDYTVLIRCRHALPVLATHAGASQKSRAFPFFYRQSDTSFTGLASRFA
jgi:hypothetical protein